MVPKANWIFFSYLWSFGLFVRNLMRVLIMFWKKTLLAELTKSFLGIRDHHQTKQPIYLKLSHEMNRNGVDLILVNSNRNLQGKVVWCRLHNAKEIHLGSSGLKCNRSVKLPKESVKKTFPARCSRLRIFLVTLRSLRTSGFYPPNSIKKQQLARTEQQNSVLFKM